MGLVLSMMLTMGEWSAFAAELDMSASITATYTNASGTKVEDATAITVDTSGTILLSVTADYNADAASSTVEILLPVGVELDIAPGVDSATSTTYTQASTIDGALTAIQLGCQWVMLVLLIQELPTHLQVVR